MSFKIVATATIVFHIDKEAFRNLDGVEFIEKPSATEDEIIAAAHDADAVIIVLDPYTKRVINSLKSCRLIATVQTGYGNIDIAAATEAGICVSRVPGAAMEEVSDHTLALLLACSRRLFRLDKAVRTGEWKSVHGPEMGPLWLGIKPITGQTLGLIGFGLIPRTLTPKARGIGLKVIAYDPYVSPEVMNEMGVEAVDLNRLLQESDFVSLHAGLTAENRHLLGKEQFKLMKPSACLINTGRGALVDEEALYTALAEGRIAGAGLDVNEVEPPKPDNPLFKLDNVFFTGHSAHYSDVSAEIYRRRPVEEVSRIMAGEWPNNFVNPEVKDNYIARWGKSGG